MRRIPISPRPDWQQEVEKWGMVYHTHHDQPYWFESAYYELDADDVERLEEGTAELHEMCLKAVDRVISTKDFERFKIPEKAWYSVAKSWTDHDPHLYGRFDLAYDGTNPPKMLEYNADTPTALLEAAVIQWQWSQAVYPGSDQFNSIWEHLVERWRLLRESGALPETIYFAHEEALEDLMTVSLMRDSALEAGLDTWGIHMQEIRWNATDRRFVDADEYPIDAFFKLYPWEWLISDEFGNHALLTMDAHQWIEPCWKMVLSNKAILTVLWEMFPNNPNLLPAYSNSSRGMANYVRKPLLSREGANILIVEGAETIEETSGQYGEEGFIYQQLAPLPEFDGFRPVIGSWVVGDEPCGIGIRESRGLITTDLAQFVPHVITSE
ncbi:MAG: glutathionylspermidine synthase family protein [Fimbriimonadaceae bacterium]